MEPENVLSSSPLNALVELKGVGSQCKKSASTKRRAAGTAMLSAESQGKGLCRCPCDYPGAQGAGAHLERAPRHHSESELGVLIRHPCGKGEWVTCQETAMLWGFFRFYLKKQAGCVGWCLLNRRAGS